MGGIVSKRKLSIKRNKKNERQKTDKVMEEPGHPGELFDEPIYMEIGLDRDNSSAGSHRTLPSSDSAFSERSSTLERSVSSVTVIYDEPGASVCAEITPKLFYQKCRDYLQDDNNYDIDVDDDDDDYSDFHTYISDISLNKTNRKEVSTKKCGAIIPLEEVPYMVEAFQPLLEQTLDVLEIVPHMSFIDVHEFAMVDDKRRAVEKLIARIKASGEPGKWRAFLHALNVTEYEYIASLLRGETEEDHSDNRTLLQLFTPQIMNRIDPEEFIDHLFEQKVINERDMEEVRCEKERRGAIAASFMLLHKVPRRISNWFQVFLDVLSKCGMEDVVQHFRIPEISVPTKTKQHTFIPSKKKRGIAKPIPRDTYQDYITPIYDAESHSLRAPPPLPPPPLRRFQFSTTPEHDTILKKRYKFTQSSENRSKTELELLHEEKASLQRQVEQKKEVKKLAMEVKDLQKELEALHKDEDEDESVDTSEEVTQIKDTDTGNRLSDAGTMTMERDRVENEDSLNGNNIEIISLPENAVIVNVEDRQKTQDIEINKNSSNDNYVNSDPVNEMKGQIGHEEHLSKLFTDMKEELKQYILAMRDHVTDAVLKSIISSTARPVSVGDNAYVTVENGQTVIQSPVMLYNSKNKQYPGVLCPASHYLQGQYSIDSAVFSDYVYA